jgi:hypothetical protein
MAPLCFSPGLILSQARIWPTRIQYCQKGGSILILNDSSHILETMLMIRNKKGTFSMNRLSVLVGCFVMIVGLNAVAETTPDDILKAVDQMSPEQVQALSDKLQARYWEPIPGGFFTRMAAVGSISGSTYDKVDLSSASLSSSDLDLESVGGAEFELLWWIFSKNSHIGFKFGSAESRDSALTAPGYSSAALLNNSIGLVANHQFIRGEHWQLWSELGVGAASFALNTINTPAGEGTTIHEYDGSYAFVDLELGVSLRLNPVISIFGAGGYTFADTASIDEGDVEGMTEIDASGARVRAGLSFNF